MIHFFNLIRWKNLGLIVLVQVLIKYALLLPFYDSHGVVTSLSDLAFYLLVISTVCIAAAGYIINDIYDVEADKINRPNDIIINTHISEKKALNLFTVLNIIGVGLGFYLSNGIGKSGFFAIFLTVSILLYLYASYLKRILLVGNIVVCLLVSLSIILVGIFELLPAIDQTNRNVQITFFKIILDYSIFAFILNFVREIIKDIEDVDGDYKIGAQTVPIVLGRERANKIVFALSLIPIAVVTFYVTNYLFKQIEVVSYFLILVIGPLIYVSIKLFMAQDKKHYKHISSVIKFVMLTGLVSIALFPLILK
ncbi:geranylgeranylglycerol-phosphate geranylgeranyltransferase [Winogradskyella sp. DF17]|uniref:Geranylgeranylglycerol-phosphate geranylgeranyltransferase n=1 Tax=Winogradskyella pelagia TaxID=2819984 RepID=A0ABS3T1C0_9FLAO|nr:geranylgeranylglycerol-phosphate geranylgeranyltransferase [Winogradskyella sp. DF17]MBO3116543.1 geranylgeranylglycerol-phosphate geranylgeranyltransferase [Winogradskyella sp. DF17]